MKTIAKRLTGGDDYLLQYWMKQFDLPKIFEGKVARLIGKKPMANLRLMETLRCLSMHSKKASLL